MLAGILCLVMPSWILAQPDLIVDNTAYSVNYNGTYQDFIVPGNAARIILNLKGGDGGKARVRYSDGLAITNTCNADGGEGATVAATFAVGNGAGKIPAGSTIRFIVGGVGESGNTNNTFAGWQTGGGGGATGILYKAPGMSNFEPLAIAGGGGGAYRGIALGFCVDDSPGRGGNYGPNGECNDGAMFRCHNLYHPNCNGQLRSRARRHEDIRVPQCICLPCWQLYSHLARH